MRVILRGWWKVLICIAVGAALGLGVTATVTKQYESTVGFFVVAPATDKMTLLQADELVRRRVEAYAALMTSRQLLTRLMSESEIPLDEAQLANSISASANQDQQSLTVTIRESDPQLALGIAESIASNAGKLVNDLEANDTKNETKLNVVSEPQLATDPATPQLKLNLLLGILAGLVAGVSFVILAYQTDTRVRSAQQLMLEPAMPLITTIPLDPAQRGRRKRSPPGTSIILMEAARRLYTTLRFSPNYANHSVVAVTSSRRGDGKTTVALYLALAFAEAGERALLIETDFRDPSLAQRLGLKNIPGLAESLATGGIEKGIRRYLPRVDVLPAGSQIGTTAPLLSTPVMAKLLEQAANEYDVVILDTTSLGPFADAEIAAALSDRVIVLARHEHSSIQDVSAGLRSLAAVQGNVSGIVLNGVPLSRKNARALVAGQRFSQSGTGGKANNIRRQATGGTGGEL